MHPPEILDTHVLESQGSFQFVRRWIRGIHPELGVIQRGMTGWETVQETRVIKPMHRFAVIEGDVCESNSTTD